MILCRHVRTELYIDSLILVWPTTLLKLIKGTHVRNGISGLPYMLCMMYASRGVSKLRIKSW